MPSATRITYLAHIWPLSLTKFQWYPAQIRGKLQEALISCHEWFVPCGSSKKVEMLKCNFATVSMFFFPDMVMNTSYASTFFCVVPRLLDWCLDLLCRFQSPHVGAGGIGFLEAPRVGSRLPVITCDYHGHGTSTSIDHHHRPAQDYGPILGLSATWL